MLKSLYKITVSRLAHILGVDQSISKKIASGYALALGTALLGTVFGLLGSHYYAQPARIQAQHQLHKKQLLNDFNNHLLSIEMHPLRLLEIAGESRIWVQHEINQFNADLQQINRLIDEIEQPNTAATQVDSGLVVLLNKYRVTILAYDQSTRNLWDKLEGIDEQQTAIENITAALSTPHSRRLSNTFEQLSEDLTRLQQTVDQNYAQATVRLQRAEHLRLIIILASMASSVGLAIALAAITSRAIARPIEQLTKVARQVTQDNDFQLRAPIHTRDEVALLAQALNQLVGWAGQYTAELEAAQRNLENRVKERTQALQTSELSLQQKADDLQDTLRKLQQTQMQLVQSEKMSSLGQMVGGIAHEINNPIGFIHSNLTHTMEYTKEIMGLLDLYESQYPYPTVEIQAATEDADLLFIKQDFPKLLQSMKDGTTRIRDIVKSLRTFSRLDEATVKEADLNNSIDSALTLLNSRLKSISDTSEIDIVRDYEQLPLVECYAGQLNQVFMNILLNAIDSLEVSPELAKPTITITTQTVGSDWVTIAIADNGSGIPEAARNCLFDPFFTTKAVGKGTGLGLSISYQIVAEKHKGQLTCESVLGQGAKFIIKLPRRLNRCVDSANQSA